MSTFSDEKFVFEGSNGDKLAGRLLRPKGERIGVAIFAHCFTCSMQSKAARRISEGLAEHGIAVLRFDFTGIGMSGGAFDETSFSSNIEDCLLAVEALTERDMKPDMLVGHSLGGAAVLHCAAALPDARLVATIGSPFSPDHVTHLFEESLDVLRNQGRAKVKIGGRPFCVSQQFVDDLAEHKTPAMIQRIRADILLMHAIRDNIVSFDAAQKIEKSRPHRTSLVPLPSEADHLLTDPSHAEMVVGLLRGFYDRAHERSGDNVVQGAEGVVVGENGYSKYAQDVTGRHIRASADEPPSMGGTDTGFSPYEFLQAGLGACTSMTLRMYADRKKWDIGQISVDVTHDKDKSSDGDVDIFRRVITCTGNIDEEKKKRLIEIADKCPVHKTLHRASRVETSLE